MAFIITELVYICLGASWRMPPGAGISRYIEDLLVTFCYCLLYGRVVVSLAHSPFPFSILFGCACCFLRCIYVNRLTKLCLLPVKLGSFFKWMQIFMYLKLLVPMLFLLYCSERPQDFLMHDTCNCNVENNLFIFSQVYSSF